MRQTLSSYIGLCGQSASLPCQLPCCHQDYRSHALGPQQCKRASTCLSLPEPAYTFFVLQVQLCVCSLWQVPYEPGQWQLPCAPLPHVSPVGSCGAAVPRRMLQQLPLLRPHSQHLQGLSDLPSVQSHYCNMPTPSPPPAAAAIVHAAAAAGVVAATAAARAAARLEWGQQAEFWPARQLGGWLTKTGSTAGSTPGSTVRSLPGSTVWPNGHRPPGHASNAPGHPPSGSTASGTASGTACSTADFQWSGCWLAK
jgi:hypothetical protein